MSKLDQLRAMRETKALRVTSRVMPIVEPRLRPDERRLLGWPPQAEDAVIKAYRSREAERQRRYRERKKEALIGKIDLDLAAREIARS